MNFRKVLSLSLLALACLVPAANSQAFLTARHSHTITLLPDGNFLVVGGILSSGAATPTAEIYITSKAVFEAIPQLTDGVARSSHTATLLGNGKVLVAGGFNGATPLKTAYLYNNQTKAWENAPSMTLERGKHTANLITKGPNAGGAILCGGSTLSGVTNTCEIYDLYTFISTAAPMVVARMSHAAAALNSGNIFVSGGIDGSGNYLPDNEIYDVGTNMWTPVSALLQGRAFHTISVLNNGNVMIAGGYNGLNTYLMSSPERWYYDNRLTPGVSVQNAGSHGYLDGAEFFDPNGGRVPINGSSYSVMPYRTSLHAAALAPTGRVNLDGGYGNMVPTFFDSTPQCNKGAFLKLVQVGSPNTANILNTSNVDFPLNITLSRPISGRVVNGDIFFPGPPVNMASISLDSFQAFLPASVARLDGKPIGNVTNTTTHAGTFNVPSIVLRQPTGNAVFAPLSASCQNPGIGACGGITISPLPNSVDVGETKDFTDASMTFSVNFTVPTAFATGNLTGTAVITGGSIVDNKTMYSISLTGGTGIIGSTQIGLDGSVNKSITFTGVTGTITNSTDSIVTAASVNFAGDKMASLTLYIKYVSDYVSLYDDASSVGATYNVTTSSFVVRQMIFSTDLGFRSSDFTWQSTTNPYDGSWPVYNHSYMITPAGDDLLSGGMNCETNPDTTCDRDNLSIIATKGAQTVVTVSSGGWITETALNEKRAYHTSTLLPDGSILTCGGSNGVTASNTCEQRDPATGLWSYVGNMASNRSRHTATLLPNGNVLLTGGTVGSDTAAVNTAEIYNFAAKQFSPTQSMSYPRMNHTATLLPDGNVLVAGGSSVSTYSATAELFITTATTWVPVQNMSVGRAQHTATLLKNGRVMVIGGLNGAPLSSTEFYRPDTRTWTAGPPLNTGRYTHTATLLRSGQVLVVGGSSGFGATNSIEIYSGAGWVVPAAMGLDTTLTVPGQAIYERANHRATLLTTGKVLVTGGETVGSARTESELFTLDLNRADSYGKAIARANHTAVLDLDGNVHIIGGWDGRQYLDSVQSVYFAPSPDADGTFPKSRNPHISTSTFVVLLDRGQNLTLLSDTKNFHGLTEASGGGTGSANSSFHNPRLYLQAMDAPSGFLIDMSTAIYTSFGGPNTAWGTTISSITVKLPAGSNELPWGYYFARSSANGQFSNGRVVQVTSPRPVGLVTTPVPTNVYLSSINWTWNAGSVTSAEANGFAVYAASNSVFLSTASYSATANYSQTGLSANAETSIMVDGYNLGGGGPLTPSATYYTLPAQPKSLKITAAAFDHVDLAWDTNGNSGQTAYEISYSLGDDFTNPANIYMGHTFDENIISSFTTIPNLAPNVVYYFRVRAKNGRWPTFTDGGGGIASAYSPVDPFTLADPSTTTVSSITNLHGTAASSTTIQWDWDPAIGADYYNVYAVSADTQDPSMLLVSSPSYNSALQKMDLNGMALPPNHAFSVAVEAVKNDVIHGAIKGPVARSPKVYTLAMAPLPPASPLTVTTTTLVASWLTGANSTSTYYGVELSTNSAFADIVLSSVTGSSTTFTGLVPDQVYYVRIKIQNTDGYPKVPVPLPWGTIYTLAAPPVNVTASLVSMSGVTLTWDANGNTPGTIYQVRGTTQPSFDLGFSTYAAFAGNYTKTTLDINGLLTSTVYYFDVSARNGNSKQTGTTPTTPNATLTLSGPNGAPAGSIGGASDPSKPVTISGLLPNGRQVSLLVPSGAFPTATALAISSSAENHCDINTPRKLPTIALEIFTTNPQPSTPVTITFSYTKTEADNGVALNAANLVLARYNEENGDCLPLETQLFTDSLGNRFVTATLNHFSKYQLEVLPVATDLSDVRIYPNPFYTNRGNGFVTIRNLPANTKVRIYTISGAKVWEGSGGTTGVIIWKGKNSSGFNVASGIYLAVIDSSAGKKVMKIAVER